ncbi:MAG: S-methyl-5-thioribose-1-phosphate isomerase, partial [Calditrichaeota bacterium]|nr:S-methyl-5-thioribose-1-phosphate isomerase [Calditrichota bacterium]
DRIARNGDSSNKIGTQGVAVIAAKFDIPFHVVAPSTTIDFSLGSGAEIRIEERTSSEVLRCTPGLEKVKGVSVWNPAFDVTPAALIHSIITERGIHRPPFNFTR